MTQAGTCSSSRAIIIAMQQHVQPSVTKALVFTHQRNEHASQQSASACGRGARYVQTDLRQSHKTTGPALRYRCLCSPPRHRFALLLGVSVFDHAACSALYRCIVSVSGRFGLLCSASSCLPASFRDLHAAVLLGPRVKDRIREVVLTAELPHRHPAFALLDLLLGESLLHIRARLNENGLDLSSYWPCSRGARHSAVGAIRPISHML